MQASSTGETIAMTAPVIQTGNNDAWTVRFIMPRAYTLAMLPVPNDPRVRLLALPPSRYAVIRFSGLAGEDDISRSTTALVAFGAARGLRVTGPALLARYNPPWTPWFMRRNEIMLPVAIDTLR